MLSTKKSKFFRFHELMCWWPTRRPEDLRLFDFDEFFRVTMDILKLSKLNFDASGTKQDQLTWKAGAAFSYVHTMWNVPLAYPERYLVFESFVSRHLQECLSSGTFPLSTTLIYDGEEARR